MKKPSVIFECDQDWDAMKPTACGRFCDVCKKEVYDLTGKSIEEISLAMEGNNELCGMLLAEQLDTGLRPIEMYATSKLKYYTAFLVTFLGLELSTGKAQEKKGPGIEVVNNEKKNASSTQAPTVITEDENGEPDMAGQPVKQVKNYHRKKIYFSKRFPFIHIRKRHVMGRVRF